MCVKREPNPEPRQHDGELMPLDQWTCFAHPAIHQQWKPQPVKNESIEKIVAILVNEKNYCVTSCVTRDMLC